MPVCNIRGGSCCAASPILSDDGCILLSNFSQLFTGPPSEGMARKAKNPSADEYPPAEGAPARTDTPALLGNMLQLVYAKRVEPPKYCPSYY
jgi:hypothetical protein